jgi:hypothetical protein
MKVVIIVDITFFLFIKEEKKKTFQQGHLILHDIPWYFYYLS